MTRQYQQACIYFFALIYIYKIDKNWNDVTKSQTAIINFYERDSKAIDLICLLSIHDNVGSSKSV